MKHLLILIFVTLTLPVLAEEPEITCTVRIEHAGVPQEGTSESSPTLEESEEGAIDAACALSCAELLPEGELASDTTAAVESDEELDDEGEEDPHELCIDACFEEAEVIGTQCWDQHQETLYTAGVFQTAKREEESEE